MSWALVMTAPHTERSVAKRFYETGVEHLLVKNRRMRVWRGRKIERLVPAFPRYIFVNIINNMWEAIRNVMGVVDFVRIGMTPADISDEVIKNLLGPGCFKIESRSVRICCQG